MAYIADSECGWVEYSENSGDTYTCQPIEMVSITQGTQYWVGVRGIGYGGFRGESTTETYYGYYLNDGAPWRDIDLLSSEIMKTGTAGILQIEVTK